MEFVAQARLLDTVRRLSRRNAKSRLGGGRKVSRRNRGGGSAIPRRSQTPAMASSGTETVTTSKSGPERLCSSLPRGKTSTVPESTSRPRHQSLRMCAPSRTKV